MPPRLTRIGVRNFRSIGNELQIFNLPAEGPVVLLGENNAGKSNLTKAVDILFGDRWPTTHQIQQHDFHGRDSDGIAIGVQAGIDGNPCDKCSGEINFAGWAYDEQNESGPVRYWMTCTGCGARNYINKELRSRLFAFSMQADRGLKYQLSYTSQYTLLSKLMHRFHERLIDDPERKKRLEKTFSNLVEEFSGVTEFKEFRGLLGSTTEEFGQNLAYRLDIDFSAYDPSNFFRSLRVNPQMNSEIRSFDELGTGQEQVLAMAFAYAYSKSFGSHETLILVIDEPEAHLHPLAQQWLATRLQDLTSPSLQLIITTHSPHFVDLSRPENLVVVGKPDGSTTRTTQLSREELATSLIESGADKTRTTAESVGSFYSAAATTEIKNGLFSRLCILVEGATEALTLPEMLRFVGFDPLRHGVAIVSAEGVTNIAKWRRLYAAMGIPVYCIFDTDRDKTKTQDIVNTRTAREDIFRSIGVDEKLADIEKLSSEPLDVHPLYASQDSNFEEMAKRLFSDQWDQKYKESAEIVGLSKPLRARHTVRSISSEGLPSPEATRQLSKLKAAILAALE